jgi:DNA-binding LacI/PurR family transcriptional regulator
VLILDVPEMFFAAQQFLQQQGLRVPEDVSMIALDGHPAFDWFEPEVSHIRTDSGKWVPQAMRWVENVSSGTNIRSKKYVKSELIRGGTIGPAPEVK